MKTNKSKIRCSLINYINLRNLIMRNSILKILKYSIQKFTLID